VERAIRGELWATLCIAGAFARPALPKPLEDASARPRTEVKLKTDSQAGYDFLLNAFRDGANEGGMLEFRSREELEAESDRLKELAAKKFENLSQDEFLKALASDPDVKQADAMTEAANKSFEVVLSAQVTTVEDQTFISGRLIDLVNHGAILRSDSDSCRGCDLGSIADKLHALGVRLSWDSAKGPAPARPAAPPPVAAQAPAPAPPRQRLDLKGKLAVLELRNFAKDLTHENAQYFTDVVRQTSLRLEPALDVMTRENLLVLLESSGKKLEDCEGECEVETGRRIGADEIISGEIQKLGSLYKMSLRLHDTHAGKLLSSAIASGRSVEELDAAAQKASEDLLTRR